MSTNQKRRDFFKLTSTAALAMAAGSGARLARGEAQSTTTTALQFPKGIPLGRRNRLLYGCAASDVAPDGNVYDSDRIMYLRNGLAQLQRATAQGVPVKVNFLWSAMDNLEWTHGYGTRPGLVYVDFKTQKRIPKLSAKWFREASRRNTVV